MRSRGSLKLDEFDPISILCFLKSMAEVRHHYVGKVPSDEEQERQTKRDRLDSQWKQARIDARASATKSARGEAA